MKLRSLAGWSILAIWLVVLGLHVRREYFQSEAARLAEGVRRLAAGTHFYVVRLNDRAIGTATTRLDTIADGFQLDDYLLIDVPALDTVQRATTMSSILLDDRLRLRGFNFRLDSPVGRFLVKGDMQADSTLAVSVDAGGGPQESVLRGMNGVLLDGAVPIRIAAAGQLEPGTELTVRTFDPSALEPRAMIVRVTGTDTIIVPDSARMGERGRWEVTVMDTVPVWRIEQELGGVTLTSWVDEDGLVVRAESALGLTIERTTFEIARQEWGDALADPSLRVGYGALIESTAIASNVALDGLEELDSLTVRLRGVDLAGFDLSGGRQRLSGDTLVITREDREAIRDAGYRLPFRGTGDPATELGATPLIQSDAEEIRRRARQMTYRTYDPAAAAQRLTYGVHRLLRKEITPGMPSALQVLEAERGDCNEHTVLYVALARSIGLPARTAVGLVHLNGRFYYHAWPEVWLADRWVAVDPTLGQFPADASHLRFIVGGFARQVELLRLLGRLQIEAP